jgi:hypothetical protein
LATRPYPALDLNQESSAHKTAAFHCATGASVSKAGIEPASSHLSGGRPCLLDHSDMAIPPGFEPGPSSLGGSRPSSWTMGPRYRRKGSNLLLVIHSHALCRSSFAGMTVGSTENTHLPHRGRGPCSVSTELESHALQLGLPILSRIAVPPEGIEPPWPLRDDGVTARPFSINVYGGMVCVEGFEPP